LQLQGSSAPGAGRRALDMMSTQHASPAPLTLPLTMPQPLTQHTHLPHARPDVPPTTRARPVRVAALTCGCQLTTRRHRRRPGRRAADRAPVGRRARRHTAPARADRTAHSRRAPRQAVALPARY
jgi:hypothetical protein